VQLKGRVLKSGYLYKIGSAGKNAETGKWQKRFFVLNEVGVFYFTNSKKEELLGCFPIRKDMKVEEEKEAEFGFVVHLKGRDFHLKAASKQDLESWLHFFHKAASK
jgi:hypothetical protein